MQLDTWILDTVLRTTLILLVTAALAQMLSTRPGRARARVWSAALGAALLLPALPILVPTGWLWSPVSVASESLVDRTIPSWTTVDRLGSVDTTTPGIGIEAIPEPQLDASSSSKIPVAGWSRIAGAVWLLGSLLVLLRLGIDMARGWRLHRRSSPVSHAAAFKPFGGCDIRESSEIDVPVTFGVWRPSILLPRSMAWTPEQLRLVLTHETAHVRRRDGLPLFLAELACAVHWFQPLAWHGRRRLAEAVEHACDEAVLDAGSRPTEYARLLLDLAAEPARPAPRAAVGLIRPVELELRIRRILSGRSRAKRGAGYTATLFVLAALVSSLAVSTTPAEPEVIPSDARQTDARKATLPVSEEPIPANERSSITTALLIDDSENRLDRPARLATPGDGPSPAPAKLEATPEPKPRHPDPDLARRSHEQQELAESAWTVAESTPQEAATIPTATGTSTGEPPAIRRHESSVTEEPAAVTLDDPPTTDDAEMDWDESSPPDDAPPLQPSQEDLSGKAEIAGQAAVDEKTSWATGLELPTADPVCAELERRSAVPRISKGVPLDPARLKRIFRMARRDETFEVELALLVSQKGRVVDSVILGSSGYPRVDSMAESSYRKSRFSAPEVDGRKMRCWQRVKWTLRQSLGAPSLDHDARKMAVSMR